jgi:hypothetical protein
MNMAVFWVVGPCCLVEVPTFARGLLFALMMEAASISETLINFYKNARRNNPKDSHLHTRRRENLKSRNNHMAWPTARSRTLLKKPAVSSLVKSFPPLTEPQGSLLC